MTTTMTTVKVPTEVRDELRRRAEAQGISQGEFIASMLEATAAGAYDVHAEFDQIDREWAPLLERLAQ